MKPTPPDWAILARLSLPASSLSFLVAVSVPVSVHFSHSDEITWQGSWWLLVGLGSLAATVAVLLLAHAVSARLFTVVSATFLALSSYVIIRGYFLPVDFGILDGGDRPQISLRSDPSMYTSLALFFLCALGCYFNEKLIRSIVLIGTIVSLGMVGVLAAFTAFGAMNEGSPDSETPKSYAAFSTKMNLIVLSLDSVQHDVFERLLARKPVLQEIFGGFTSYSDVTSFAPNTRFSLLSTLTGRHVRSGLQGAHFEELFDDMSAGAIPTRLLAQGMEVDTFGVSCRVVPGVRCHGVDSVVPDLRRTQGVISAYEVAALRLLPASISQRLIAANQRRVIENFEMPVAASDVERLLEIGRRDKKALGFKLQLLALRALYEKPTLIDQPVFKFYHYVITHFPARFDEECGYDTRREHNFNAADREIECALRELDALFSVLKELGVYDRSVIIVMSDHGYEGGVQPGELAGEKYLGGTINENGIWSASRYWPILLVKPFGAHGAMKVNDARVSLVDVAPTLCSNLPAKACEGLAFDGRSLSASPIESRIRKAMIYVCGMDNWDDMHIDTRLFENRPLVGHAMEAVPRAMNPQ